jgi:hypothetical protein
MSKAAALSWQSASRSSPAPSAFSGEVDAGSPLKMRPLKEKESEFRLCQIGIRSIGFSRYGTAPRLIRVKARHRPISALKGFVRLPGRSESHEAGIVKAGALTGRYPSHTLQAGAGVKA